MDAKLMTGAEIENFDIIYLKNQTYLTEKLVEQMTHSLYLAGMVFSFQPNKQQLKMYAEHLCKRQISRESFQKLIDDIQVSFDKFPSLNQVLGIIKNTSRSKSPLEELKLRLDIDESTLVQNLTTHFINQYDDNYLYRCTISYVEKVYDLKTSVGFLPANFGKMQYVKCFLLDWYDSIYNFDQVIETANQKLKMIANSNNDLICLYLNNELLTPLQKSANGKTYKQYQAAMKKRMRT